jgi:hypothetical protein
MEKHKLQTFPIDNDDAAAAGDDKNNRWSFTF